MEENYKFVFLILHQDCSLRLFNHSAEFIVFKMNDGRFKMYKLTHTKCG